MEEKREAVTWDLDYTLIDSVEQNYFYTVESVKKVTGKRLADFPALKTPEIYIRKMWSYHSWRDFYTKELGLTHDQLEEVSEAWKTVTPDKPFKAKFYPGLPATISSLAKLGFQQAIQSDNILENINKVLDEKGLKKYFGPIIDYHIIKRESLSHKPSPDGLIKIVKELGYPSRMFCIGDVMNDMLAAEGLKKYLKDHSIATDVTTIWATYGLTPERIALFRKDIKADYTAGKPEDILKIIKAEVGR